MAVVKYLQDRPGRTARVRQIGRELFGGSEGSEYLSATHRIFLSALGLKKRGRETRSFLTLYPEYFTVTGEDRGEGGYVTLRDNAQDMTGEEGADFPVAAAGDEPGPGNEDQPGPGNEDVPGRGARRAPRAAPRRERRGLHTVHGRRPRDDGSGVSAAAAGGHGRKHPETTRGPSCGASGPARGRCSGPFRTYRRRSRAAGGRRRSATAHPSTGVPGRP